MELLTDKIIYHVETQEDYDDLMEKLYKLGCEWMYTDTCISVNYFLYYGENTAIRVEDKKMNYSRLSYYLDNLNNKYENYQIIKYKKEQNMKVKLKADQKFIADWYDQHKDSLDYHIYRIHIDLNELSDVNIYKDDFLSWMNADEKGPVQTLVKMHLFGYEIEQEPVYYVELPNPNYESKVKKYYLARTADGRIVIQSGNTAELKENWKLTESEIKKDFGWAWEFAKEV